MWLWSVSEQSTSVMLRNKCSILDIVCHVAMKFDATIKGECSECGYGLGECSECGYGLSVDSPRLLCFVTSVVFWTLSVTLP